VLRDVEDPPVNQTNLIDDLTLVPLPVWWENPWVVALGLVALGGLIWALIRWWRRPRSVPVPSYGGPFPPVAADEALRRLRELRTRVPAMKDYDLAIEASEILRGFIEGRHQLPIRYQTTREFLEAAAGSSGISVKQRTTLEQFLGFCDLGKFARQPATEPEMLQTVDIALFFVQEALNEAQPGGRS